jgi:hypothetical protein
MIDRFGQYLLDRKDYVVAAIIIFAAIFRYWITAGFPITAFAHGVFDDALFIRLAESVVSGEWFGDYDMLTLVKAPLYSLFIAINYLLGLQFKAMEHAIYIIACVVFYLALVKASVNRYIALVVFLFLLFNPFHHNTVERGWFYAALTFLVVSGLLYVIALRVKSGYVKSWHAFLLGLGIACLYLSREEMLWLYPLLLVAFGILFYIPDKPVLKRTLSRILPVLVLGIAFPIVVVMSGNYMKYGYWGVTDTSIDSFKPAMRKIKSVRAGDEIPFVDVTQKSFDQIYSASPTFAKLRSKLQGDLGAKWGSLMCRRKSSACGEIGGGYLFWALREALETEGYFQQVDKVEGFFSDVDFELKNACEAGQLDCSRFVWPVRYPIRLNRIDDYLMKIPGFVRYMVTGLNGLLPGYGQSMGPEDKLLVFEKLSNTTVIRPSVHDSFIVSGWLLSDSAEKYLAIVPKPFGAYTNRFSLKASKDVQDHYPENIHAGLSRFSVEGPCINRQCEFLIKSGGQQVLLNESLIRPGADLEQDGLHLHIDSVERVLRKSQSSKLMEWKAAVFKKIGAIYNSTLAPLSLLAFLVFLYVCHAFWFKGYRNILLAGAIMAFLGIFARLGVLALFDDFTQQALIGQIRHFIPIMPLLLMFISLNFLMLLDLLPGIKEKWVESLSANSDNRIPNNVTEEGGR